MALRAYAFAAVMGLIAIVPGCNFLYSGHGGVAWLIVPFVFPVAVVRLFLMWKRAPVTERTSVRRFAFLSVAVYIPLSFAMALAGSTSIEETFGLPVKATDMWAMFLMPIGLLLLGGA